MHPPAYELQGSQNTLAGKQRSLQERHWAHPFLPQQSTEPRIQLCHLHLSPAAKEEEQVLHALGLKEP